MVNIVAVHSTRRPLCGDAAGGSAIGERVLLFLAFGGGSWVARPTKSAADCAGLTAVDKSWMCMVFLITARHIQNITLDITLGQFALTHRTRARF